MKKIIIIAGPNGAGKTTFANEFLPYEANCPLFINADVIAKGLSPYMPEKVSVRAGRIMLQEINMHVEHGENFAFETTLSGILYAPKILNWKNKGYLVKLIYLSLPSVEIAVSRVSARVKQGGHFIPEATIRRRFYRSQTNFEKIYTPIVDSWILYDNSSSTPCIIDEGENDASSS